MPPACKHGAEFEDTGAIGALFRDHGEDYIRAYRPCRRTIKLIRAIRVCRTPALGGQRITCQGCGHTRYQYHSCGHSHCPQCHGLKRLRWQDRLRRRMLPVPYCHITFTLPHGLNGLARRNQRAVYNLLFRSAWKTVKKLCGNPKNVGGLPGMSAVLHTWGSDLKYHVHAHCLVTFGGYDEKEKAWRWPRRPKKIARYRKLSGKFKAIFLDGLERLMEKGQIDYHMSYEELESSLPKKRWVVNHQWPTTEPKVIEEYLGRYICRIGISHKRLSYDKQGGNVRITYNNYREQEAGKPAPKAFKDLPPLLAMHQILQHLLPPYFQRSRHSLPAEALAEEGRAARRAYLQALERRAAEGSQAQRGYRSHCHPIAESIIKAGALPLRSLPGGSVYGDAVAAGRDVYSAAPRLAPWLAGAAQNAKARSDGCIFCLSCHA